MPDDRDDKRLDEYLEGDSELSRAYRRGSDEEPSPALDAAILAHAKREVATRPRVVHSPFARHWLVPTSLAAVLVISVSVVLLSPEPGTVLEAPADRAVEVPPAEAEMDRRDAPAPLREAAPALERAQDTGRARPASPGQAAPARKQAGDAVGKSVERREAFADEEAAAPAAEPRPATGAASAVAPAPRQASEAEAPAASMHFLTDDPDVWIREIEALAAAGENEAALANLRAFRARYPDYSLPATLSDLAATLETETR